MTTIPKTPAHDLPTGPLSQTQPMARLREPAVVSAEPEPMQGQSAHHPLSLEPDESVFKAIADTSPVGIFQTDERGHTFYVNDRLLEIAGLSRDQCLGLGLNAVVHPDDRALVQTAWAVATQNRQLIQIEFRLLRHGHELVSVGMRAQPTSWGQPRRQGFAGVLADLTSQKQADQQRRETLRFLERAEQMSGVGGWEADLRTKTMRWTEQNYRIYELPLTHQPQFDDHLKHLDPAAHGLWIQTTTQAIRNGQAWDVELPATTATGRAIWVRTTGRAEFEAGQPVTLGGTLQDVTQERRAREQLAQSNALLQGVLESLPCGLSAYDAKGRLIAANRQHRQLLGYPDALFEAPEVTFESLILHRAKAGEYGAVSPEQVVRDLVEKFSAPQGHRVQRTRPNGMTLDIRGGPMPGGGWVATIVDVTETRQSQERLQANEEMLRRALEATQLAMWDLDVPSGRLFLSEHWSQMLGGPSEPTHTHRDDLLALVPQAEQVGIALAIRGTLLGATENYAIEHHVATQDGRLIWIRSKGRVVERDEKGHALRMTGTNRDITARKSAQEHNQRTTDLIHATLESTKDGILVLNERQDILLHNQSFLRMWELGELPLGATTNELLLQVAPLLKDADLNSANVKAIFDNPQSDRVDLVALKNGRIFERHARPMLTNGTLTGHVISFHDVSAQQTALAETERARQAAEAANHAKSDFLANMSHEIRTPLNGVMGMADLLLAEALTPRQRQYAEMASASAKSLLSLVNDLLDISKIEAGKLDLEHIPFNLHELLAELHDLFGFRAREKGLAFAFNLAPQVAHQVQGDPSRLRQILTNLLGNALKFTAHGHIGLSIRSLGDEGNRTSLRFTVDDTGIGIAKDLQHQLFTRFTQADNSTTREFGGTGLGLAIARQLCEHLGGHISLVSDTGQGCVFHCDLPFVKTQVTLPVPPVPSAPAIAAPAPEPEPEPAPAQAQAAPEPAHQPLRILVAEDNLTNQMVIVGLLKRLGYSHVTLVDNGQKAVDAALSSDFGLILMDCRMPVMDGYVACEQLRALGYPLPIIAVTANASVPDREKCLRLGMNDYLAKPVDASKLRQAVERWTGTPAPAGADAGAGHLRSADAKAELPSEPSTDPSFEPSSEPSFDRATALSRLAGNSTLLGQAIESFITHSPPMFDTIATALAASQARPVQEALHSLGGSAAMVGAQALHTVARSMEQLIKRGDLPGATRELPTLRRRFDAFVRATQETHPHT